MAKRRRTGSNEPARTLVLTGLIAAAGRVAGDMIVRLISELIGGGNPLC